MRIPCGVLLGFSVVLGRGLLAEPLYSVTDLGTLGGFTSQAFGINDRGQVTGQSETSSGTFHAFLYSNGQMVDLGALPGFQTSSGYAINNNGQVVGDSTTSSRVSHAVLYSDGLISDLGTLPGYSASTATAINNNGQITGRVFRGVASGASAINDAGQITGTLISADGYPHPFIYSDGQMLVLPDLGESKSINNAGQIVGVSYGVPFLYSNGQSFNLNNLVDPAIGVTLYGAFGINNQGQIIANGIGVIPPNAPPETEHAYLLTPASIPEPSTWALMGLALSGLWFWSRHFHVS